MPEVHNRHQLDRLNVRLLFGPDVWHLDASEHFWDAALVVE